MNFKNEKEFHDHLLKAFTSHHYEILHRPTEKDLIENLRKIISDNNKHQLNHKPLTNEEVNFIINSIKCKSIIQIHDILEHGIFEISRRGEDGQDKKIYLTLIDKDMHLGTTKYQVASEFYIKDHNGIKNRRGDLLILINGLPLLHLELKSGFVNPEDGFNQLNKYVMQGLYKGIFNFVQVFATMDPNKFLYFARAKNKLNRKLAFPLTDSKNVIYTDFEHIMTNFFNQCFILDYCINYITPNYVNDNLLIMRSYQIHALRMVKDIVKHYDFESSNKRGGFIWHTTGSGKTLTTFNIAKSLIRPVTTDSNNGNKKQKKNNDPLKVIFIVDRIELTNQTFDDFKAWSKDQSIVSDTSKTKVLAKRLASDKTEDSIIVTSIHKLSILSNEHIDVDPSDLEKIKNRRYVILVDECHRSTFGLMLTAITSFFKRALLIGFTGTPIFKESEIKEILLENDNEQATNKTSDPKQTTNIDPEKATVDIFGKLIHTYSLANAVEDESVLNMNCRPVNIYNKDQIIKILICDELGLKDVEDFDPNNLPPNYKIKYDDYKYNWSLLQLEEKIYPKYFNTDEYKNSVIDHIIDMHSNLTKVNDNSNVFHAIFAVNSIKDAIRYYELFQERDTKLKVFPIFTDYDNNGNDQETVINSIKTQKEIVDNYNKTFNVNYTDFKDDYRRDVLLRLRHASPYKGFTLDNKDNYIDIVIVVDQLLTGFDSKWINTIYLDKVLERHNLIQAFSRTNRICENGITKPCGNIIYFRKPKQMKLNIDIANSIYSSGDKTFLVPSLEDNLKKLNFYYAEIKAVFECEGLTDFKQPLQVPENIALFVNCFQKLKKCIDILRYQGFNFKDQDDQIDYANVKIEYTNIERSEEKCSPSTDLTSEEYYDLQCIYQVLYNKQERRREKDPDSPDYVHIEPIGYSDDPFYLINYKLKHIARSYSNASSIEEKEKLKQDAVEFIDNADFINNKKDFIDTYFTRLENGENIEPQIFCAEYMCEQLENQINGLCRSVGCYNNSRFMEILKQNKEFLSEDELNELINYSTQLGSYLNLIGFTDSDSSPGSLKTYGKAYFQQCHDKIRNEKRLDLPTTNSITLDLSNAKKEDTFTAERLKNLIENSNDLNYFLKSGGLIFKDGHLYLANDIRSWSSDFITVNSLPDVIILTFNGTNIAYLNIGFYFDLYNKITSATFAEKIQITYNSSGLIDKKVYNRTKLNCLKQQLDNADYVSYFKDLHLPFLLIEPLLTDLKLELTDEEKTDLLLYWYKQEEQ